MNNLTTIIRIINQETQEAMCSAVDRIKERAAKECPGAHFKPYGSTATLHDLRRIVADADVNADVVVAIGNIQFNGQDFV